MTSSWQNGVTPTWDSFLYGGDYNPDQWPKEIWDRDIELMQKAGWNIATLPVFGWAALEPEEGVYTLDWLQEILDKLQAGGIRVCLATATASVPAWLAHRYPDVLITMSDGKKRKHGDRHVFCPHSPNYRRLASNLVRKIAETFGHHPAVALWHINNEYGWQCYCDLCAAEFRIWLQKRYASLDELNYAWNTAFWGHTYRTWEHIEPPFPFGETSIHGLKIDYYRFQSEALAGLCRMERDIIKSITPELPVTTNFMGTYFNLDYHQWAKDLDVCSWDSYPAIDSNPSDTAFGHSLTRGLKNGQPFLLMETSPSQQNWSTYSRLKPPGWLRAQGMQAVAHGADSVMYFQWRKSPGGFEKYHGAVVEHGGDEKNRVFQEVAQLGSDLQKAGIQVQGGVVPAKVAILFDWPNWWSFAFASGPNQELDYCAVVRDFYGAFHRLGIDVEVVSPSRDDWSSFDLIVAPLLNMLRPDDAQKIKLKVQEGATLVATTYTGLVDASDRVNFEGAPGHWREVLGLSVMETDSLPGDQPNEVVWSDGVRFPARLLADRVRLEGAEIRARYGKGWYKDEPAITENFYGEGRGFYLATLPTLEGLTHFFRDLITELGLSSPLAGGAAPPLGVEVAQRLTPGGEIVLFVINHTSSSVDIPLAPGFYRDLVSSQKHSGRIGLAGYGVLMLVHLAE
ncbi:MAG: beta-galactosidase [Fimbriimonadaceae bacterium]|nr:beta-galactosidase [Fimbriimonadaceae bacterium]